MKQLIVNREDLKHNINRVQEYTKQISKNKDYTIIAVVKGNGYGSDLKKYTEILKDNGITYFAVATLEEIAEEHNTKVFEQYLFNNKQYKDMIANQANVFTNSGYSIPKKQITNVMNELIKTIGEHNGEKA